MNVATKINKETLAQVAAESIAKINPNAANGKRWINAITKAVVELENNPYCDFDEETHSLLICSSSSGEFYTANGTCQCEAYKKGFPCYHRAAARLVARCIEREQNKLTYTRKGSATFITNSQGNTIRMFGI